MEGISIAAIQACTRNGPKWGGTTSTLCLPPPYVCRVDDVGILENPYKISITTKNYVRLSRKILRILESIMIN